MKGAPFKVLGEVRVYADLHEIMRTRAVDLQMSRETIEARSGITGGLVHKILAVDPSKRLGDKNMPKMLRGMAMKLIAVVDEEAEAQIISDEPKRNVGCSMHAGTVHIKFSKRRLRKMQRNGGQNSRKYLSKRQRTRLAKKAARARWHPKIAGALQVD